MAFDKDAYQARYREMLRERRANTPPPPPPQVVAPAADGSVTCRCHARMRMIDREVYGNGTWVEVYLCGAGHTGRRGIDPPMARAVLELQLEQQQKMNLGRSQRMRAYNATVDPAKMARLGAMGGLAKAKNRALELA